VRAPVLASKVSLTTLWRRRPSVSCTRSCANDRVSATPKLVVRSALVRDSAAWLKLVSTSGPQTGL
jgi:hypothetical protein